MRPIASLLLLAFVLPAAAAETWRWRDANGVVHYSDRPIPGAERVNIGPSSQPGSARSTSPAISTAPAAAPQPQATVSYSSCTITAPANDETFNAVSSVSATVQVAPLLQDSHRIQVLLDGRAYADWPERLPTYTLMNLNRGSHTLSVRVQDADGRVVCNGSPITFHVRQPSLLSPARQAPRRP